MTSAIETTAETLRRRYLIQKRVAVRTAAQRYAQSANLRFDTLFGLGITPGDDTLHRLKLQLRAQVKAKAQNHWTYSMPKHIAILSAVYGEMLWLDDQPRREVIRKQNFNNAVGSFVNRNQQAAE